MRDLVFEMEIVGENVMGVTFDALKESFKDLLVNHPDYVPTIYQGAWCSENIFQSASFSTFADLFAFSALVALRKANGLRLPEGF